MSESELSLLKILSQCATILSYFILPLTKNFAAYQYPNASKIISGTVLQCDYVT